MIEVWSGLASAEATNDYMARLSGPVLGRGQLGATGLHCGRVGISAARLHHSVSAHAEALRRALTSGCNVIGTAGTYADGYGELAVGAAIAELFRAKTLAREQVVLVSKIGRVRGAALARLETACARTEARAEVVAPRAGGPHCLHPHWLEAELCESRRRLQVASLDVCLLEEPEYQLRYGATPQGDPGEEDRQRLYARLEQAFEFLEDEVRSGRLGYYGVSSAAFGLPSGDREHMSTHRMLAAARRAGGLNHHLRFIEIPFNVMESAALLDAGEAPPHATVLETAARCGLAVLATRPLEAMVGVRLVDLPPVESRLNFEGQLHGIAAMEAEFFASPMSALPVSLRARGLFSASATLRTAPFVIAGPRGYRRIEHDLHHQVANDLAYVDRYMPEMLERAWKRWRERYKQEVVAALHELRGLVTERARRRAEVIRATVDAHLPADRRTVPLAHKALWAVVSVPEVSTVLTGLRAVSHVDDALAVLTYPPIPDVAALCRNLRAVRHSPQWERLRDPGGHGPVLSQHAVLEDARA
jgi:uncharacterized protein